MHRPELLGPLYHSFSEAKVVLPWELHHSKGSDVVVFHLFRLLTVCLHLEGLSQHFVINKNTSKLCLFSWVFTRPILGSGIHCHTERWRTCTLYLWFICHTLDVNHLSTKLQFRCSRKSTEFPPQKHSLWKPAKTFPSPCWLKSSGTAF